MASSLAALRGRGGGALASDRLQSAVGELPSNVACCEQETP